MAGTQIVLWSRRTKGGRAARHDFSRGTGCRPSRNKKEKGWVDELRPFRPFIISYLPLSFFFSPAFMFGGPAKIGRGSVLSFQGERMTT